MARFLTLLMEARVSLEGVIILHAFSSYNHIVECLFYYGKQWGRFNQPSPRFIIDVGGKFHSCSKISNMMALTRSSSLFMGGVWMLGKFEHNPLLACWITTLCFVQGVVGWGFSVTILWHHWVEGGPPWFYFIVARK